jgi:hypothetical protein
MIRAGLTLRLIDLLIQPQVELTDVPDNAIDDLPERRAPTVQPRVIRVLRRIERVNDPLPAPATKQRVRAERPVTKGIQDGRGGRERLLAPKGVSHKASY